LSGRLQGVRLKVEGLSIVFGGRRILDSVNFSLGEGEAILIAGPSGSGKTTLLRTLAGLTQGLNGFRMGGRVEPALNERQPYMAYLPQEPWYGIATPYVWSEVTSFSREPLREIDEALSKYGMSGMSMRTTYTLSAGETQRLALLITEVSGKQVLLLDEPTSHLDIGNAERIREGVKAMKDEGRSMIIVDHNPAFWEGVVDRKYVVWNGGLVEYSDSVYAEADEMLRFLRPPQSGGGEVLSVHVRRFRHPGSRKVVIKDFSLTLREGEVASIYGPSGAGKTTLLKIVASSSLLPRPGADIALSGRLLFIPDNPLLFFTAPTLIEEVGKANASLLEEFQLYHVAKVPVGLLSTGERRRGAVASALSRGASVILADEPTIGLDPMNKVKVLDSIVKAAEEGCAFIIATHDPTIRNISNRVIEVGGS
jgi:ABC-type multidrug transport system ATPase subunit